MSKCDLELVYLKNWVFGEVKKIRAPIVKQDADEKTTEKSKESKAIITSNVADVNVITHNVPRKSDLALRKQPAAVPKKMTECKSSRKQQNIDYSQLAAPTDERTPPHKHRRPNLLHKPSKTVLEADKKRKLMYPLSAGKMDTTTKKTQVHVSCTEAKASTSISTATEAAPPTIGIVTVDATEEETKTAIATLLSFNKDIPPPDDDPMAENAALVPLNPNISDTNIADTPTTSTLNKDPPVIKPVAVPVHKRFVTVEYKLKRKYRRPRKFPGAKCGKCFSTQKEINGHFKDTQPPVKCDDCD